MCLRERLAGFMLLQALLLVDLPSTTCPFVSGSVRSLLTRTRLALPRGLAAVAGQLEDAFEVGEQHLHLLAIAPRLLVLRCLCDLARDIPRSLVHAAHDSAVGHVRATFLLHCAASAVMLTGACLLY